MATAARAAMAPNTRVRSTRADRPVRLRCHERGDAELHGVGAGRRGAELLLERAEIVIAPRDLEVVERGRGRRGATGEHRPRQGRREDRERRKEVDVVLY